MTWLILCDAAELAIECGLVLARLGADAETRVELDPLSAARARDWGSARVAFVVQTPPSPEALVELSAAWPADTPPPLLAICSPEQRAIAARDLATDLGIASVTEVSALGSMLSLIEGQPVEPWVASTRTLDSLMRARLGNCFTMGERGAPAIESAGSGLLSHRAGESLRIIGTPRDVREAVESLKAAALPARETMPTVQGVDIAEVLDAIFGPSRELSDPASKRALSHYDIPLPVEDLCTSPSRASAEAARIGFPVRVSLASPDLRVWDHPDLISDGITNGAGVRDVFRQLMAMARDRAPDSRLLGVTVSATEAVHALLGMRLSPLPHGHVLVEIGFADPHGQASEDRTFTLLPANEDHLERALSRLRGVSLILQGRARERRQTLETLADVLLRLGAFVHDCRDYVNAVTVNPLALLVGGDVEIREMSVEVGDAFSRGLEAPDGALSGRKTG